MSEPARPPASWEETLEKVEAATVFIEVEYRLVGRKHVNGKDRFSAWGSGFVIGAEGLIVTNAHVVKSTELIDGRTGKAPNRETPEQNLCTFRLDTVRVRTHSGTVKTKVYEAEVLCVRPLPADLALLRIQPREPLLALDLQISAPKLTQEVWAVGFPLGLDRERALIAAGLAANPHGPDISVRRGAITAINREAGEIMKAIEHNCNVERGNSGGPLVNADGEVLGIVYLGVRAAAGGTEFAIPAAAVGNEFASTFAWLGRAPKGLMGPWNARFHRVATRMAQGERRTLHVAGDAKAYPSIDKALADARVGDTVVLAPGVHVVHSRLVIGDGVCVRGAGKGKTKLLCKTKEALVVLLGRGGYLEFSHLTIQRDDMGPACVQVGAIGVDPERETYVHDIELAGDDGLLVVHGHGSPDIISCRVEGVNLFNQGAIYIGHGSGGKPRLERLELTRDQIVVSGKAGPVIEGCRFSGGLGVSAESGAFPDIVGCLFSFGTAVRARGPDTRATVVGNIFSGYSPGGWIAAPITASEGARVEAALNVRLEAK